MDDSERGATLKCVLGREPDDAEGTEFCELIQASERYARVMTSITLAALETPSNREKRSPSSMGLSSADLQLGLQSEQERNRVDS